MKITGKYETINPLYSLYVTFGLLVVAIPFRMYQHLNILEPATGFYKVVDWSVYLMYGLSILAIVIPYLLTTLAKNVPASKSPFRKNKFLALASFIFASGIILDVVVSLSKFFITAKEVTTQGFTIFGTIDQAQAPLLIESVFGVFAAIYIIIFGISFIDGRTTYAQYKFLALSPLFWAMSRIVVRFMRKIAYINVSDLMLELFAIMFMMIFLLSFARICAGLVNNKAMRTLFASGFVAIFFCLVANIPRLLIMLTGNGRTLANEYSFALCDFGFALFALAYIVNTVMCAKENDSLELVSQEKEAQNQMETDDNFLSE